MSDLFSIVPSFLDGVDPVAGAVVLIMFIGVGVTAKFFFNFFVKTMQVTLDGIQKDLKILFKSSNVTQGETIKTATMVRGLMTLIAQEKEHLDHRIRRLEQRMDKIDDKISK